MKWILALVGVCLSASFVYGHGTSAQQTITIDKPDVPYVDFEATVSGHSSTGSDVPVETIGRKSRSGNSRATGEHTPAKSESDYSFNEKAPPNNTKTFRTYIDCNGQDGYLTSQVDASGKVIAAHFSPKFDPSDPKGLKGTEIKPNFVGPEGVGGSLNEAQQIALTKGQLSGSLGGLNCGKSEAEPKAGGCAA